MCLLLVGCSLTACGGSGEKPSAAPPSTIQQSSASESVQSESTTAGVGGMVTTEGPRELNSKELVLLVCDVIVIAEAEVGANPVAVPELYGPEFLRQLSNRLSDAQMAKGFDVTRMRNWLHFSPSTSLREGIAKTYKWFLRDSSTVKLKTAL